MAIFARRVLQRMLEENALIDRSAAQKHAHRINRCTEESIATEWEVAILNGLSKFGSVSHEPDPAAPALLDIHFEGADGRLKFIGDVVTVTDLGLEKQNPITEFEREVVRQARKMKLNSLAGFYFDYGDWTEGTYRDRKVFIAVPDRTRFLEFFDDAFRDWLRQVRDQPTHKHAYQKRAPGIDVTIAFTPGELHAGRHSASFTVPLSLTRNPLYHALDRKADQFKRSGLAVQSVIFACDGGSESIKRRFSGSAHSYSAEDIVGRFFADHSVPAVVLVRVEQELKSNSFAFGPPFLRIDVLINPAAPPELAADLRSLAGSLLGRIPAPESDVINAINHLRWKNRRVGLSNVGGLEMNKDYVKMSARAVQELLAGRMTAEQFLKEHAFVPAEGQTWTFNPFDLALTPVQISFLRMTLAA